MGAGKTTMMLTIAGLIPSMAGSIQIHGEGVKKGDARAASRAGLVLVPDDRSLFTGLTVSENLRLATRKRGSDVLDTVLGYFPALKPKLKLAAGQLSGGEQQMLAVGRALMQQPKVLMIDELSMGLAPVIVRDLLAILRRVVDETGAAAILVEQHIQLALRTADTAVVLAHGSTVLRGSADELTRDPSAIERAYLGGSGSV